MTLVLPDFVVFIGEISGPIAADEVATEQVFEIEVSKDGGQNGGRQTPGQRPHRHGKFSGHNNDMITIFGEVILSLLLTTRFGLLENGSVITTRFLRGSSLERDKRTPTIYLFSRLGQRIE